MKVLTLFFVSTLCLVVSYLLPIIGVSFIKTTLPLGLNIPLWVNGVIVLFLIGYIFLHKWQTFGILFITGGMISNVMERFVQGYVKDYIPGPLATYNLADVFIITGIILLLKHIYYGPNKHKYNSTNRNPITKPG
jgi:lipoprotein signal peptidase